MTRLMRLELIVWLVVACVSYSNGLVAAMILSLVAGVCLVAESLYKSFKTKYWYYTFIAEDETVMNFTSGYHVGEFELDKVVSELEETFEKVIILSVKEISRKEFNNLQDEDTI